MYLALLVHMKSATKFSIIIKLSKIGSILHLLFVEGLILRVLSTGLLRVGFLRSVIVALR